MSLEKRVAAIEQKLGISPSPSAVTAPVEAAIPTVTAPVEAASTNTAPVEAAIPTVTAPINATPYKYESRDAPFYEHKYCTRYYDYFIK